MIEAAYETLKVGRNTTPDEVRRAYVRLVRRYPPEHFPEKFAAFRKAYQQLLLGEDFLQDLFGRMEKESTPLDLVGLLWGDRKEFQPDAGTKLTDLASLLMTANKRVVLDEILEKAASKDIVWKT
jgi:curved DNA-binding protein CbpA